MFERFGAQARAVVAGAQDEARALRHGFIGTEHLLLSLLAHDCVGGQVLHARGMTADAARDRLRRYAGPELDAAALATLGIDLDKVRRVTEERFGPGALDAKTRRIPCGHIPFTKRAKKVLELSVREATALDSGEINSAHLLLGLLQDRTGLGARLVRDAGVDVEDAAAEARIRASQRAA